MIQGDQIKIINSLSKILAINKERNKGHVSALYVYLKRDAGL